jgi:hypothetical protein
VIGRAAEKAAVQLGPGLDGAAALNKFIVACRKLPDPVGRPPVSGT